MHHISLFSVETAVPLGVLAVLARYFLLLTHRRVNLFLVWARVEARKA